MAKSNFCSTFLQHLSANTISHKVMRYSHTLLTTLFDRKSCIKEEVCSTLNPLLFTLYKHGQFNISFSTMF